MTKKKSTSQGKSILLIVVVLVCLTLLIATLLRGKDLELLAPKGQIAHQQLRLLLTTVALLLEIAIPTLILFYTVAWKYREGNEKAAHAPDTHSSKSVVFSMWAFPVTTMLLISALLIPATHKLDPRKSIQAGTAPITVQVVAMRWKWLFIYPAQHIASVNFMQMPVGTPIQFDLTADETPMSSFWIPHLGGQLYAMTGHVNRLNLIADAAGDFRGSDAEINGAGFAGMKFMARAGSQADFDNWVQTAKASSNSLTKATYADLLKPSESNPEASYGTVDPALFGNVLTKYASTHNHTVTEQ